MIPQTNIRILLILTGLIILWAPIHMMTKIALDNFSSQAVVLVRWSGVSLILWSLLFTRKFRVLLDIKKSDLVNSKSAILIGLIFLGPAHTLGGYAYQHTTSIEASVLATSGPVWTTLMAFFLLKEKIHFMRRVAICFGIVGAYIITMGLGVPQFSSSSILGNSLFLVYVLLESCALIYAKKFLNDVHGVTIVAWQAIGTVISLFIASLVYPTYCLIECYSFDISGLLAMSYLVIIAGIFCFTIWYMIAQKAPISLMALTGGIEPLVGTILGVIFLKEKITIQIGIGILFIIASMLIGSKESKKSSLLVEQ